MQAMSDLDFNGLKWSRVNLLCFALLLGTRHMDGLADFSSYLSRILTNQSARACDGQPLRLHCPRHSTISVQAAFYGSNDAQVCTNDHAAAVRAAGDSCSSSSALQKLLSECQSHRECQLPVNHLLFGKDPCPGTTKYLHVDYKCKPTEHKSHVVCEGGSLLLRCKPPKVLNIYAAVYGRALAHRDTCPSPLMGPPQFDCLNPEAVHTVSRSCYSKQRCVIAVGDQTFRDPCFPGTRKYLAVLYSCVGPADVVAAVSPKGSRRPDYTDTMLSNSLTTYTYIKEHPETAALLFTSSVCVGLLFTLLAVSLRVTCRGRALRHHPPSPAHPVMQGEEEEEDEEEEDDYDGTDCSLLSDADRKTLDRWEEEMFTTEAAERVGRMERREMVIQEIRMNA
ncbi:protein eva-1 homolog C [Aplochiton taeniatus]